MGSGSRIVDGYKPSSLTSDDLDQSGFNSDRSSRASSSSDSLVDMAFSHGQTPLTKASTPATLSSDNLLAKGLVSGPLLQMTPMTNIGQIALASNRLVGGSSVEISRIYVLSAFDKATVDSQMRNLAAYLKEHGEENEPNLMQDLAYTLAERRSLHNWRVAFPAASKQTLIESLESGIKPVRSTVPPRLGFVFTGQGAQWARMGLELMNSYPIFASTIRAADRCLGELGAQWSLIGTLLPSSTSFRIITNVLSRVDQGFGILYGQSCIHQSTGCHRCPNCVGRSPPLMEHQTGRSERELEWRNPGSLCDRCFVYAFSLGYRIS